MLTIFFKSYIANNIVRFGWIWINVSIVGGFMQILLHVNRGLSNVEILQRGPISLNCRRTGGRPGGSE